jgi:HlyD family secretion protein
MSVLGRITACGLMLTAMLFSLTAVGQAQTLAFDGLIEPYRVVDIGTPVEGIVAMVVVDRSSMVQAGQTVVELESSVEQAIMKKAQAAADFDGEINLQWVQLQFAKRVYERLRSLTSVSTQDKDKAATEIELARRRLEKAHEDKSLAALEVNKAKMVLARRLVKSPIAGVVVDRYVSPGEYVDTKPLLRVAQIDPLRVETIVPDRLFGKIKSGMTATIIPELARYGLQTATVKIVDKVIDSASSTFGVRLEFPNPDHRIPSGLRCQVRFDIDENADQVNAQPAASLPVTAKAD